jgi:hypothetical protein
MVKLNISKRKIVLGGLLLLVVAGCIVAFVALTSEKGAQKEAANQNTAENIDSESETPPPAIEPIEPPQPSEPEICKDINRNVITGAVGSDFTMSGGREAETDNDSSLRECNYSKEDERVSIRIYEYESEAKATADVSEVELTGYETSNQGKYVVSVSVLAGNAPNASAAGNILSAVLEEL